MQLRLPWMSRAEANRLLQELLDERNRAKDEAQTERVLCEVAESNFQWLAKRYEAMEKHYFALRVKGANPEPAKPAPLAPRPNLTPVDYAIENRVARANPLQRPALERHLRQYVASQKQLEGYDEDAVCSAITNGHEAAD